jgi:hypothetical protein
METLSVSPVVVLRLPSSTCHQRRKLEERAPSSLSLAMRRVTFHAGPEATAELLARLMRICSPGMTAMVGAAWRRAAQETSNAVAAENMLAKGRVRMAMITPARSAGSNRK